MFCTLIKRPTTFGVKVNWTKWLNKIIGIFNKIYAICFDLIYKCLCVHFVFHFFFFFFFSYNCLDSECDTFCLNRGKTQIGKERLVVCPMKLQIVYSKLIRNIIQSIVLPVVHCHSMSFVKRLYDVLDLMKNIYIYSAVNWPYFSRKKNIKIYMCPKTIS